MRAMVRSLFGTCCHAVAIAVVKGQISNLSGISLTLRLWLFDFFRIKRLLDNLKVLRVFGQPGFFDGFAIVNAYAGFRASCESRSFYTYDTSRGRFLTCLLKHLDTDRKLAENITDVTAGVSVSDGDRCRQRHAVARTEDVWNLLRYCRNLKRLRLIAGQRSNIACLADLHNFSKTYADTALPTLEHLSLVGYQTDWTSRRFPKRLFASLQSLQLLPVRCDRDIYRDILTCCRDTLVSLDVVDESDRSSVVSPVPIVLPNLRSLVFRMNSLLTRTNCGEIADHCPNLTTATLKLWTERMSETELTTLAELSKRFELHVRHEGGLLDISEMTNVFGQDIAGLSIDRVEFVGLDCRRILSNSSNLTCLDINKIDAQSVVYLQTYFNDKQRAAKLAELRLEGHLSPTLLQSLFENCFNLRSLMLKTRNNSSAYDDYLRRWIANGARPSSVVLTELCGLQPSTIYSIMKVLGPDLREIALTVRSYEPRLIVTCLNTLRNFCPFVEYCEIRYRYSVESDKLVALFRSKQSHIVLYPLSSDTTGAVYRMNLL